VVSSRCPLRPSQRQAGRFPFRQGLRGPQGNHLPFDLGCQAQHRGGDPALDRSIEHQLLFGDVHTHPLRHTVLQHLQDLQGGARHAADFGEEHCIASVHRLHQ
jgi:hypothetical protein